MTELELMRKKIDEIDEKLLVLFKERLEVSKQIGILKSLMKKILKTRGIYYDDYCKRYF